MSDRDAEEVYQVTLLGEEIEAERVTCEVYPDVCSKPAEFEVSTLEYDGMGWDDAEVAACESCALEFTEPEHPDEARKARRLGRIERWNHAK